MPNLAIKIDEVVEATPDDIACILKWLKSEYDEDSGGFWSNRTPIENAANYPGDIWVIRRNQEPVAFQLGKHSADILSVRKDYRKSGLGRALVQASIERAFKDDINVLSIQCKPEASIGFWERLGFIRYDDPDYPDHIKAHFILPRPFALPEDLATNDVVIGFYPESALYGGAVEEILPIAEHRVKGHQADDGSIMLSRRVVGHCYGRSKYHDIAVKIEVDGAVRCFRKGKSSHSRNLGVQQDGTGDSFFIDRIESFEETTIACRL